MLRHQFSNIKRPSVSEPLPRIAEFESSGEEETIRPSASELLGEPRTEEFESPGAEETSRPSASELLLNIAEFESPEAREETSGRSASGLLGEPRALEFAREACGCDARSPDDWRRL